MFSGFAYFRFHLLKFVTMPLLQPTEILKIKINGAKMSWFIRMRCLHGQKLEQLKPFSSL